jgi:hypothetical protein
MFLCIARARPQSYAGCRLHASCPAKKVRSSLLSHRGSTLGSLHLPSHFSEVSPAFPLELRHAVAACGTAIRHGHGCCVLSMCVPKEEGSQQLTESYGPVCNQVNHLMGLDALYC